MNLNSIRTDVDYAIKQIQRIQKGSLQVADAASRAMDALERVQHELLGDTADIPLIDGGDPFFTDGPIDADPQ